MGAFTDHEETVIEAEWLHIAKSWRQRRSKINETLFNKEREELRGVALSGGGIRSAAFAIGALQALHKGYVLSRVHYLSTVSGGGYAGTALTWFLSKRGMGGKAYDTGTEFPLDAELQGKNNAKLLEYLRFKSSYLEPGLGLSKLSLLAIVVRSTFLSLLAYLLLLTTIIFILKPLLIIGRWPQHLAGLSVYGGEGLIGFVNGLNPAGFLGGAILIVALFFYLVGSVLSALKFWPEADFLLRRWSEQWMPYVFGIGGFLLALAILPWAFGFVFKVSAVEGWLTTGVGKLSATISAIAGIVGAIFSQMSLQNAGASKMNFMAGMLLFASSSLVVAALAIAAFTLVIWLENSGWDWWKSLALLAGAGLVIGGISNMNYAGLHRFYRDRLLEAFLPDPKEADPNASSAETADTDDDAAEWASDRFNLGDACAEGQAGPYHLINANVILTTSETEMYRGRGGDNFVLSPLYCGGDATGWIRTDKWINDKNRPAAWPWRLLNILFLSRMRPMTLATAMAISGAAINPRTTGQGASRSGLLSFDSMLLNIRLGYWVPNPRRERGRPSPKYKEKRYASRWAAWYPPNFLHPGILGGLLAARKTEDAHWIELSDGGHFENIGLYELVRRRVKNIIVIDGSTDPDLKLASFASAYELARNDFGVKIDISGYPANFNDMMSATARPGSAIKTERKLAERGFAVGVITYPPDDTHKEEEKGFIFYVNTVLTERLPANLYSYHAEHPDFPDEPISDQFFDERQFEAYRELGCEITWDMLRSVALYADLARAAGLLPSDGELAGARPEDKKVKGEITSKDIRDDFNRMFPRKKMLSVKTYKPDPDRLDWPPPTIKQGIARAASSRGKFGRRRAKK